MRAACPHEPKGQKGDSGVCHCHERDPPSMPGADIEANNTQPELAYGQHEDALYHYHTSMYFSKTSWVHA